MTDAPIEIVFKKVTSVHDGGDSGYTFTAVDYIAEDHVLNYVLHQNATGWSVTAVEDDDRAADADRTYNPPAYLTEGTSA